MSGMKVIIEGGMKENVEDDHRIFRQRKERVDSRLTVCVMSIKEIHSHEH